MAANDNQRQRRMAVLPCAILTRAAAANTLESAAADLGFGRIFVSETGAPDYPLSKSDIKRLGINTAQQCGSGSLPQTSRSHGASSASCARRAPSWYCHVGPETAVFGRQALCTRANAPYKRKLIWCGECEGRWTAPVGPGPHRDGCRPRRRSPTMRGGARPRRRRAPRTAAGGGVIQPPPPVSECTLSVNLHTKYVHRAVVELDRGAGGAPRGRRRAAASAGSSRTPTRSR